MANHSRWIPPTPQHVRLPFGPLRRFVECEGGAPIPSMGLAVCVGVSHKQIDRWKRDGIGLRQADDAACHLGVHPYAVWGDDWFTAVADPGDVDPRLPARMLSVSMLFASDAARNQTATERTAA